MLKKSNIRLKLEKHNHRADTYIKEGNKDVGLFTWNYSSKKWKYTDLQ